MKRVFLFLVAAISASSVAPRSEVSAGEPCAVPKEWGKLVQVVHMSPGGIGVDALVFEDEAGTLRKIVAECKMPAKPQWVVERR